MGAIEAHQIPVARELSSCSYVFWMVLKICSPSGALIIPFNPNVRVHVFNGLPKVLEIITLRLFISAVIVKQL
jgi:hypothetical protein